MEVDDLNQTRVLLEDLTIRPGLLGNDDLTSEESDMDYVSKLVSVGFSNEIPESDVEGEEETHPEEGNVRLLSITYLIFAIFFIYLFSIFASFQQGRVASYVLFLDLKAWGIRESDLIKLHSMCSIYRTHKDVRIRGVIREIGKEKPAPEAPEEPNASGSKEDATSQETPGPSVKKRGITWSLENNQVRTIPARQRGPFVERRSEAYQNRVIRQMNSMALEERRRLVATHVLSRGENIP